MGIGIVLNRNRQAPAEETPAFGGVAERFRRAGDADRAIALCREGLRKFPNQLSARVTLGWALLDKGEYDAAREELEQVLRRAPDNLAAIRGLAELHDRASETMDSGGAWHREEAAATSEPPQPAANPAADTAVERIESPAAAVALAAEAEVASPATVEVTPSPTFAAMVSKRVPPPAPLFVSAGNAKPALLLTSSDPVKLLATPDTDEWLPQPSPTPHDDVPQIELGALSHSFREFEDDLAPILSAPVFVSPAGAEPVGEVASPVVEAAAPVVEAAAPVVEAAAPVVEVVSPVVEASAAPEPLLAESPMAEPVAESVPEPAAQMVAEPAAQITAEALADAVTEPPAEAIPDAAGMAVQAAPVLEEEPASAAQPIIADQEAMVAEPMPAAEAPAPEAVGPVHAAWEPESSLAAAEDVDLEPEAVLVHVHAAPEPAPALAHAEAPPVLVAVERGRLAPEPASVTDEPHFALEAGFVLEASEPEPSPRPLAIVAGRALDRDRRVVALERLLRKVEARRLQIAHGSVA